MQLDTEFHIDEEVHKRRWSVLAVLCLAVFVTVMDGTIVNVALPSLVTDLGATTRELQWIVDAYLLVFTGLLLAAGSFGDRYGRRRALLFGLTAFLGTSVLAGSMTSPGSLIVGRGLMGIGAALIFPATLAVLTNTFADPKERAAAIGIWSAMSGVAVAAGPRSLSCDGGLQPARTRVTAAAAAATARSRGNLMPLAKHNRAPATTSPGQAPDIEKVPHPRVRDLFDDYWTQL